MSYIQNVERLFAEYQYWIYAGAALVLAIVASIGWLLEGTKRSQHGDGRFATDREIEKSGLQSKEGIVVAQHKGRVLRVGGSTHLALVAPTRSDKGVSVVTPTCMAWHTSLVANDKKNELFYQTSMLRESYGQKVYKWAPYSLTTHRYNPLDYVSDDPMSRVESIQSIAYILYPAQHKESMWTSNARALFVSLVLLVVESDDIPSTIGEVYRISCGYGQAVPDYLMSVIRKRNYNKIVSFDDKGVETIEWVKKPPYTGEGVPPLSETCVNGLMSHIKAPSDTSGGILNNMQAPIQIWASEKVDAATSASDFDLRTLRKDLQSIYLHIPPNKTKQATVLLNLFYSQLVNCNMDELTGEKYPHKVLLAIDEFGSLHLPIIEDTIGELAGYGVICMLIFQSKGQIRKSVFDGGYGEAGADNLMDNCMAKLYFTPEKKDSEEISQLLGDTTVKAKSVQLRNRWHGSESEQRRPLMLAQELREMSQKLMIVKVRNCRAIKCKKIVWYKNPIFRNRLWGISKALNGNKSPTEEQIQNAGDELCSFVPTLDVETWMKDKAARVVIEPAIKAATVADVNKGISLEQLAIELPAVPAGKMTQQQRVDYADSLWSEFTKGDEGETIGYETGEIKGRIDLSVLNVA